MSTSGTPALRLSQVSKSWRTERGRLDVLRAVDLTLSSGVVTALRGRSGSGKSTLLAVAGLLASPDSGQVLVQGLDTACFDEDAAADVRAREVGMVFQAYNLVVHLSALDNVALAVPPGTSTRAARETARARLAQVGLESRADHLPGQLSGGEQQRVAVARALVNGPSVLLADEPTGNLDADSERDVLAALRAAADAGCAVLVVTHDREVAEWADVRQHLGPTGSLVAPEAAA